MRRQQRQSSSARRAAEGGCPHIIKDPDLHNPTYTIQLTFGGEVLADTLNGIALAVVEGEEFESVSESLAVADNGADFDGIGRQGQRNVQRHNFTGIEAAGEGGANAILAHFGGASPAGAELSGLEHFDL